MIDNTKDNTINSVTYRMLSIDKEQLISNSDVFETAAFDEDKLKFQFKTDTVFRISEGEITVTPQIRYTYDGRQALTASAVFTYSIQQMDTVVSLDEGNHKIAVKADILPSLIGAAYSSLRGIVYARTDKTGLAKFPLPLIDSKTLVENSGISVE